MIKCWFIFLNEILFFSFPLFFVRCWHVIKWEMKKFTGSTCGNMISDADLAGRLISDDYILYVKVIFIHVFIILNVGHLLKSRNPEVFKCQEVQKEVAMDFYYTVFVLC